MADLAAWVNVELTKNAVEVGQLLVIRRWLQPATRMAHRDLREPSPYFGLVTSAVPEACVGDVAGRDRVHRDPFLRKLPGQVDDPVVRRSLGRAVRAGALATGHGANLRRNPGEEPLSPGTLATRCGVTPAAISLRIRRAEESGWVTRERAASDARSVRVRLTASGRVAADRFAQLVLEHDDALTAELSDRDLDELERLRRRLGEGVAPRAASQ